MANLSAEVRWFARASRDADVFERWFRGDGFAPGGGKERCDRYALDASTDELGAKTRGEQPGLEIKALVESHLSNLVLGNRAAKVQLWTKVTSAVLTQPQRSLVTRKVRWLRKFDAAGEAVEIELGGGDSGEEAKRGVRPKIGCNVEWTAVDVPALSQTWRTLALEAFAYDTASRISIMREALEKTVAAVVARYGPPPEMNESWHELSYPGWLRQLEP